jgi:hypothetical protein
MNNFNEQKRFDFVNMDDIITICNVVVILPAINDSLGCDISRANMTGKFILRTR